jgi:hypothetical protein
VPGGHNENDLQQFDSAFGCIDVIHIDEDDAGALIRREQNESARALLTATMVDVLDSYFPAGALTERIPGWRAVSSFRTLEGHRQRTSDDTARRASSKNNRHLRQGSRFDRADVRMRRRRYSRIFLPAHS